MAEHLDIAQGSKEEQYETLLPQIESLMEGERDAVANMANIASAIHFTFPNLWTGFYVVRNGELVLGPFQGPLACTRIALGRGVCGTAWKECRTLVVPNVAEFPGHIACSSESQSEIVVPIVKDGNVVGVIDIDSASLSAYDDVEARYLERVAAMLVEASDM